MQINLRWFFRKFKNICWSELINEPCIDARTLNNKYIMNTVYFYMIHLLHTYCIHQPFFLIKEKKRCKIKMYSTKSIPCKSYKYCFYIIFTKLDTYILCLIHLNAIVMLNASSVVRIILQKSKAGTITFMKMKKILEARRRKK